MAEPAENVHQLPGTRAPRPARPSAGPVAPEWLSPAGRALWRKLVPAIENAAPGWLKDVDSTSLAFTVEHAAMAQTALKAMRRGGGYRILEADAAHQDTARKHPAAQVFRDNAKAFMDNLAALGLSPKVRRMLDLGFNGAAAGDDGDDDGDDPVWSK